MATLYYSHPVCVEHDTGPHHPERPERLRAIERALQDPAFDGLDRRIAPLGRKDDIARVHLLDYIDAVLAAVPSENRANLDPDTVVSPQSSEAALRAVGAVCAAVDGVASGDADNAFCAVRPPGHHAEPNRAMGFCLFNNVAIAARYGQAAHGWQRVAVVDFDVHHGNGTQAAFWENSDSFYASSHQMPAYPGSGHASETGNGGVIVNVPLPPGAGSAAFRDAYRDIILPELRAFSPDAVFISAGFDAHVDDPLASMCLETNDFEWVTVELMAVAQEICAGRIVSVLEGGYDLNALGQSVAAHIRALMSD